MRERWLQQSLVLMLTVLFSMGSRLTVGRMAELVPLQCDVPLVKRAEDLNIPPERLEIHPSVILLRNFVPDDKLDALEANAQRCFEEANANDDEDSDAIKEDRYFGSDEAVLEDTDSPTNGGGGGGGYGSVDSDSNDSDYKGHSVVYLNQCLDTHLYEYFVGIVADTFETMAWLQRNGSSAQELGCHTFPADSRDVMQGSFWESPEFWTQSHRSLPWSDLATLVLCRGLNSRIIEFLSYTGDSSIGWHEDSDTDVTLGVMVSEAGDFDGGEVHFMDDSGSVVKVSYERGDAALWSGWTQHYVAPLKAGLRKVFVNEFWTLPFNNHRLRMDPDEFLELLEEEGEGSLEFDDEEVEEEEDEGVEWDMEESVECANGSDRVG